MLAVACRRLRALCPGVRLRAITRSPETLRRAVPGVEPVVLEGRELWPLFPELRARGVPSAATFWEADRWLRRTRPSWSVRLGGYGIGPSARAARRRELERYRAEIEAADVVVAPGGGWLAPPFARHAALVLATLADARARGARTAAMGFGFEEPGVLGPIAADALAGADAISLRSEADVARLAALGVPRDRIATGGDDAVEAAWERRTRDGGTAVGVALREAAYAALGASELSAARDAVLAFARRVSAPVVGLPVAIGEPDDRRTLRRLLGEALAPDDSAPDVDALAARAARCRVVLAGAYHAAVFALAQGVPVVAFAAHAHYVAKFEGLVRAFPAGIRVVTVLPGERAPALAKRLASALRDGWWRAPEVRERLLAAAAGQVEANRAAWARLAS